MWYLNDDRAVPPLPSLVQSQVAAAQPQESLTPTLDGGDPFLDHGCWVMQLTPYFSEDVDPRLAEYPKLHGWTLTYVGTMRVEWPGKKREFSGSVRASGDLYIKRQSWSTPGGLEEPGLPISKGIPIYPLTDYAFYFTLESLLFTSSATEMKLALHRYFPKTSTWGTWQSLTAKFEPERTPREWRRAALRRYHAGWIYNDRGSRVAKIEMGKTSSHLRRAEVEIAVAPGLDAPIDNDDGLTLRKVFQKVGWDLTVREPIRADGPKSGEIWQQDDLHTRMLQLRSPVDLDLKWIYHVLIVPRFYKWEEYAFGQMYDIDALDTNLVPREGLVLALEARFPNKPKFGLARGRKLGDVKPAAFHALVHELGHSMGLLHRYNGSTFMQALIHIATQGTDREPFPYNLNFHFDSQDELRLRHHPDPWVRPGGAAAGQGLSYISIPLSDARSDVSAQFDLTITPLYLSLPLGAPVRIEVQLKNKSDASLPGPIELSLPSGSLMGRVIDPTGRSRPFSAAAPLDFVPFQDLKSGESRYRGETLWRGSKGALFPIPGSYRIEVDAEWVAPGGIAHICGRCNVQVLNPTHGVSENVAYDLIGSEAAEDLSHLLIFRASSEATTEAAKQKIERATQLLQRAVSTEVFYPTVAAIEARRLAGSNLLEASRLIEDETYMTTSEIKSFLEVIAKAKEETRNILAKSPLRQVLLNKASEAVKANFEKRDFVRKVSIAFKGS